MPIPDQELKRDFILARADETVGDMLARLPHTSNRRYTYVIIPVAGARYIVVRWTEIEEIAIKLGHDIRGLQFAGLPESALPAPVVAVEQDSISRQDAMELRDQQPGRRLVVLKNGRVIGLYRRDYRAPHDLPPDPFADLAVEAEPPDYVLGETDLERPVNRETAGAEPPEAIPAPVPAPQAPGQPPAAAPAPPPDDRVINAWIDGLAKDAPLQLEQTYQLNFNVASPRKDGWTAPIDAQQLFHGLPPEVKQVEIIVVLDTDDFTIYGNDQQIIVVPRAGKSFNTATFTIMPKKNGPGVIKALFFANNRVFQKMTLTLQVGVVVPHHATLEIQNSGLTLGSAVARQSSLQTLDLVIIKKEAGYQFRLQGGVATRAFVNLSETQIDEMIGSARNTLKELVYLLVNNQYVYQGEDTTIPQAVHAESLKKLAKLGAVLYRKLFYGPGSGPDARAMGDLLRQLSRQHRLKIGIVAERFIFPWALLYDRDDLQPDLSNVDAEGFWGFKHILEYMPEFSTATLVNFIPEIAVSERLGVGFVVNTTIDQQLPRPIIQQQREFLQQLPGITLSEYPNCQNLYDLLNNPDAPIQLLYFYCHAMSNLPGEAGGVAASKVILSDGQSTLDDLNFLAGTDRPPLKQAPLIFLNACQGAELSPYLYDGLVPYFIAKGARGVIGTEVDTPALFAAEFAQEFLKRFVAGNQPLGELLLTLRREYLTQKNNVMGLVYALYSNADVVVQRAPA